MIPADFTFPENAPKGIFGVQGIPEPTAEDLVWWDSLRNKNAKHLFNAYYNAAKDKKIWRVAKCLDHNKILKKPFNPHRVTNGYSAPERVIGKYQKGDYVLFQLFFFDGVKRINDINITTVISHLIYANDVKALEYFHSCGYIKGAEPQILKCTTAQINTATFSFFLKHNIDPTRLLNKYIADKGSNLDIIKLFLNHNANINTSTLFEKASEYEKQDVFHFLCQEKYTREKGKGLHIPIKIADSYIQKALITETQWKKVDDTTIMQIKPWVEGARLRHYFDFAARCLRTVEDRGEITTFLGEKNFNDCEGAAHLILAKEEMLKLGGTVDTSAKSLRPAVRAPKIQHGLAKQK